MQNHLTGHSKPSVLAGWPVAEDLHHVHRRLPEGRALRQLPELRLQRTMVLLNR